MHLLDGFVLLNGVCHLVRRGTERKAMSDMKKNKTNHSFDVQKLQIAGGMTR